MSLLAHQRYDTLPPTPLDLVMRPPTPDGVDVTDFDRHQEIFESSYRWAQETIAASEAAHHPAIAAIVASAEAPDKAADTGTDNSADQTTTMTAPVSNQARVG